MKQAIEKLVGGKSLTFEEAEHAMNMIMNGESTEALTSAYLTALAVKGETVDEICASAKTMRAHAEKFPSEISALEIVGTGGDHSDTFNISTTSAIVLASLGVPVAKHGNRAATSKCGAADLLEELGVNLMLSPDGSARLLKETGICFLFAQRYHTAMKYVAPVRKQLPFRTVFNLLGPLTNPAKIGTQLMGVYSETLVEPMAHVLSKLGIDRGMVFYGTDGLDEISPSAPTLACKFKGGNFELFTFSPTDYGLPLCKKEELVGGTPQENAAIFHAILSGEKGAKRNAVLLNAAFALHLYRGVPVEEGISLVEEALDSGKALQKAEEFAARSRQL